MAGGWEGEKDYYIWGHYYYGKIKKKKFTSLGLGKGVVQVEDHLVDKVADVMRVATAYEQLPVVRKS